MTWQNWASTANADPARRAWPRSTEEIGQAIAAAAKDGLTVRALGSGHSFTPAAATSGVALDLSAWTGVVGADLDSGLVTVRSGTTIRELNATLDTLGLAMANLGDIDAQTVSGAISTGTHGTGSGLGGIATQVAGLELVLADGSVVSCSADETPTCSVPHGCQSARSASCRRSPCSAFRPSGWPPTSGPWPWKRCWTGSASSPRATTTSSSTGSPTARTP